MIIMNQQRSCLYNWEDVARAYVSGSGLTVCMISRSGQGGELGRYNRQDHARTALAMMGAAIRDGETMFEFPSAESFSQMVHREQVKTKANKHGGS